MKKFLISNVVLASFFLGVFLVNSLAFGAAVNFSGSFRSEADYISKPGLNLASRPASKSYLLARALLQPNVVVDDRFSVYSQWNLLTSPNFTPNATAQLGQGQGGFIFGDTSSSALVLNRAWLEWTSDFGVFRLGRMPFSWGYGLIWDGGRSVWDDYQTTLDRMEYRLNLGHISGALAYSRGVRRWVSGDDNTAQTYTIYLKYENPESEVEAGILYEKQSNSVVDTYVRKTAGYFTLGGEVGWLTGNTADFNGDGADDSVNALGMTANLSFQYHRLRTFLDFIYASGDTNLLGNEMNGFLLLNPNRRFGLILGRELLGAQSSNDATRGSLVAYGGANSFSGVVAFKPGISVAWSEAWTTGLEVAFAQKAAKLDNEEGTLGLELDLGAEHSIYRNFDLGAGFGVLIPGAGLGVAGPPTVFGVRMTAALKF